ncbi:hypothetical protein CBS101457_003667 [Exobasidium rhododendri]|nr:hypothetical protein CBS101457_003667 [Exobasidium rhododendri]
MRAVQHDERYITSLDSDRGWGHEQAGLVPASLSPSASRQEDQPRAAIWDRWNVPSMVTDPDTGRPCSMKSHIVIELLVHRFYAQPSFNSIVVPNHAKTISRLKHGIPTSIPAYLLHAIVACAVTSSLTTERELRLWQAQVWHGATEAVHFRLNRTGPPELELVQALLLLSCNWPGSLLRVERINTFDTAITLATSLQLHSGRHLDVIPGPRADRIMLFWALFCVDKIVSVLTKRSPAIPTELHSMPLPSINEVNATLSPLHSHPSTVAVLIQRLASAFITLSQITETVQQQLLLPIFRQHQQVATRNRGDAHKDVAVINLEEIFRRILPIEKRLEVFCKEQRWLIGSVSTVSPICQSLAEAVISQLHFTQLHLYLPALQFEVDRRRVNAFVVQQPFQFSSENVKPLAATIESAWHLTQLQEHDRRDRQDQPERQPHINAALPNEKQVDGNDLTTYPSHLLDQHSSLNFSHACILIGVNFFKFLQANWSEWNGGHGCLRFAPLFAERCSSTESQQQHEYSMPHHHSCSSSSSTTILLQPSDVQEESSVDAVQQQPHPSTRNLSISDKASAHFVNARKSILHSTPILSQQIVEGAHTWQDDRQQAPSPADIRAREAEQDLGVDMAQVKSVDNSKVEMESAASLPNNEVGSPSMDREGGDVRRSQNAEEGAEEEAREEAEGANEVVETTESTVVERHAGEDTPQES